MSRIFEKGVLVPLPCFFTATEEVDYNAYSQHIRNVCINGIIPVVSGSLGEAVHIDHDERRKLIITARQALDSMGKESVPIMAGVGALSTRESIKLAKEAAEAGADYAIVIPPGYYAGAMTFEALKEYFKDIAAASPIPVFMYNFPAVSGGIDMSSDLIEAIAIESPNIVGIKLTCGSVGKLGRLAQKFHGTEKKFTCLAGFIDFMLPTLIVGGKGAVTGVPNFAPKTCAKLWDLCERAMVQTESLSEANRLHYLVSQADWEASKVGIAGMKALLSHINGYGPNPRRPLLPLDEDKAKAFVECSAIVEIMKYEKSL